MESLRTNRGFTLIEMLVVAAIIIVITAVIFTGQSNFNNSILLTNTSYDVALSLHDAETYGLGTRAQGSVANAGYGLDFKRGAPSAYTLFADISPAPNANNCHGLPANGASAPNAYPGDCIYGAGDASISSYTLGNNMTFSDFCAYDGSWACAKASGGTLSQLDITFSRPNSTPFFSENGRYKDDPLITSACLQVTSPQGESQYVNVYEGGQITLSPDCEASGGGLGSGPPAPPAPPQNPPTCTMTPSSNSISWLSSSDATSASIDNGIGSVALNGSAPVSPSVPTTYTMTVTGAGGTGQCQATVTPAPSVPAPTCILTASPTSISSGSSSRLSWHTTDAASLIISGGVGSVPPTPDSFVLVSPTISTTYTGTVSGAGGTSNCSSASVTVTTLGTPVTIYRTSGTSWPIPSDWNNAINTIEVIGGGGGGGGGTSVANPGISVNPGAGGGGGGYAKAVNVTLSGSSVSYAIGAGGLGGGPTTAGGAGTATNFGSYVSASGGGGGSKVGDLGGSYGNGTIGSVLNKGGGGGVANAARSGGGGGGGGAGGPNGVGASGDGGYFSGGDTGNGGAGGGGGADGGAVGAAGTATAGGKGGNSYAGTGGGAGSTSITTKASNGTTGGGGGGYSTTSGGSAGGNGGTDAVFGSGYGAGSGGGGGAGKSSGVPTGAVGGAAGGYGGGGGGGGTGVSAGGQGGNGTQGIIVITYTPIVAGGGGHPPVSP